MKSRRVVPANYYFPIDNRESNIVFLQCRSSSPSLAAQADYEEPVSFSGTPLPVGSTHDRRMEGGRTEEDDDADDGIEEPPYADIDASQRHSDYMNVDTLDLDSDEEGDEQNSPRLVRGAKYAPSVKLHKHPLLKKSLSNSEVDDHLSMVQLMKAAKKPKNRAPPPPPGQREENKASPVVTKHKRSQSDVHSESSSRDQRSRIGGQRSPIPESGVSAAQNQKLAPRTQSSSQDRPSAQSQRLSAQLSPKSMPPQEQRVAPQMRSHPVGRVPPPPIHRAVPSKPSTPVGGAVGGASGRKERPKSFIPSHPPPPPGPAPPGPNRGKGASAIQPRHVNAREEERGAGHQRLHPPPGHDQSHDSEHRSRDQDQGSPSNKPKRHAPPPPMGGATRKTPTSSPEVRRRRKDPPPPAYAEVMKGWQNKVPPKPTRLHRTRSLESISNLPETQVSVSHFLSVTF